MLKMEETDIRPYNEEAKKECIWHENGTEDHFGLYKFADYP